MDKLQKSATQTPTPKSKFEDSPVFNYINNLSPIEPVKSISTAQTFSSLSFTSPPPVFTSPHANSHRESRFFRCHNNSADPSKPLESLEGSASKETVVASAVQDLNKDASLEEEEETSIETSSELPQILTSDCQTPDLGDSPSTGDVVTEVLQDPSDPPRGDTDTSSEHVKKGLQKMLDVREENDTPDCGRELLVFRSPNDSEAFRCLVDKISSSERRFCAGVKPTKQPDITKDIPANGSSNECELPNESVSNLHRGGMRRRCLDFEVAGKRKKDDQQTVCDKKAACESSSRCVLPGVGLHLNAIAMSSKKSKINLKYDLTVSGEIQKSFSGSTTPILSQDSMQETLDHEESETREGQAEEEVPKALVFEELNPGSHKKKMRMIEQVGEGDSSCKRCNCKKSKCLKLYCECFAAGVYCIEPCSCVDCFNKPIHEETVLATRKQIESRNPLAFAPKVIRNSDPIMETGYDDASKTPASARHKRGCNCKKSNCLKKYCECYQGGVGCSINCRCEGCKNAFGKKEGSLLVIMESGKQEEDHEAYEKRTAKIQHNSEVSKEVEQNPSSDQPSTPLPPYRHLVVHQPFLSKNRLPPTQFFLGTGSSSSFRKEDSDLMQSRNEKKPLETVTEDKTEFMSEILITSPITTIKAISPNSKRISPPNHSSSESGSILGKRNNGRKLILRSIPAFPSLNPNQ